MPRASVPGVAVSCGVEERPPVGEAFAGLLGVLQAADVAGPADQAVRDAVAVLVDDDAVVEVAVPSGVGLVPDEHLHARALAVGRGEEVGVVDAAAVLRLGPHVVVAQAAAAVVVDLEVARRRASKP